MMLKRITYIAPHKTAITMSIVFGVVSLLFVMPIFYFLASYIVIGLSAWLYNKVVKFTGGIAYEAAV